MFQHALDTQVNNVLVLGGELCRVGVEVLIVLAARESSYQLVVSIFAHGFQQVIAGLEMVVGAGTSDASGLGNGDNRYRVDTFLNDQFRGGRNQLLACHPASGRPAIFFLHFYRSFLVESH